jgi:hypothetical protein
VRAFFIVFGLTAAATFAGFACGGTSSESPWPIEPEHKDLGPTAEASSFVRSGPAEAHPRDDADERPDAGKPRKPAAKP